MTENRKASENLMLRKDGISCYTSKRGKLELVYNLSLVGKHVRCRPRKKMLACRRVSSAKETEEMVRRNRTLATALQICYKYKAGNAAVGSSTTVMDGHSNVDLQISTDYFNFTNLLDVIQNS